MIAGSTLILLAAVASKIARWLGIPAIILFLAIGMTVGSDGPGGVAFSDYEMASSVGTVALAFILFSGGLSTNWRHVQPVLKEGLSLATIGVVVTAMVVGVLAAWILNESLLYGCLLGATISSTDAAAVFSVLRARTLALKDNMGDLLELESGINDPTAVILTVTLVALLGPQEPTAFSLFVDFVQQVVFGFFFGWLIARLTLFFLNRYGLDYPGLYPVVFVATSLLVYGVTATAGGSGFLAVYIAGLLLGNSNFTQRRSVSRFFDAIAWLSQIAMFLVLGLLVFPEDLIDVAPQALLISAALVFVARPISVFVGLAFAKKRSWQFKALTSWVGLRGAVPIILATFPLSAGIPKADLIFNVVFFTTVLSVMVQGTTVAWVARKLGMVSDETIDDRKPDTVFTREGLHQVVVQPNSLGAGKRIVELDVPRDTLFVLVSRENEHELPHGSTVLMPGDTALLLGSLHGVNLVKKKLTHPT